jgi:hypothetical protein
MQLVSSRQTKFIKWVLPVIGGIFLIAATLIFARNTACDEAIGGCIKGFPLIALVPALMLPGIALLFKMRLQPLADEVWSDGTHLQIKRQGRQLHIPITDIIGFHLEQAAKGSDGAGNRHATVTLHLRVDTPFGRTVAFIPCDKTAPPTEYAAARSLIGRLQALRDRKSSNPNEAKHS